MSRKPIRRTSRVAAVVLSLILLSFAAASAQQNAPGQRNLPGRFDFYVLALSWSPTYCAEVKERGRARLPQPQCSGRPFAFVVHGPVAAICARLPVLLPEAGAARRARLGGAHARSDAEPGARLSRLGPPRHLQRASLRKARAAVKVPPSYLALDRPITVTPGAVADAFLKANPGLQPADFAVACDQTRLTEVRICLAKDFSFHDCAEVVRRACRRDKLAMPAMRGG
jgi:ribonuclease T2